MTGGLFLILLSLICGLSSLPNLHVLFEPTKLCFVLTNSFHYCPGVSIVCPLRSRMFLPSGFLTSVCLSMMGVPVRKWFRIIILCIRIGEVKSFRVGANTCIYRGCCACSFSPTPKLWGISCICGVMVGPKGERVRHLKSRFLSV